MSIQAINLHGITITALESLIQGSCIKLLDLSVLVISLDLFALVTY